MKINHRRKNCQRANYTGSKIFDSSCRNHGSCKYCQENRLYYRSRIESYMQQDIRTELFPLFPYSRDRWFLESIPEEDVRD